MLDQILSLFVIVISMSSMLIKSCVRAAPGDVGTLVLTSVSFPTDIEFLSDSTALIADNSAFIIWLATFPSLPSSSSSSSLTASSLNIVVGAAGAQCTSSSGVGGCDASSGANARLLYPFGLCADTQKQYVYVTDNGLCTLRKVTVGGSWQVTTIAGGDKSCSSVDGNLGSSRLNVPRGCVVDSTSSFLYLAEWSGQAVRRVSLSSSSSYSVLTLSTSSGSSPFGKICQVQLSADEQTVYATDWSNGVVYGVDINTHVATTVAGVYGQNNNANGSPATSAHLMAPCGFVISPSSPSTLYINPDYFVVTLSLSSSSASSITTFSGSGASGSSDGSATTASFGVQGNDCKARASTLYCANGPHIRVIQLPVTPSSSQTPFSSSLTASSSQTPFSSSDIPRPSSYGCLPSFTASPLYNLSISSSINSTDTCALICSVTPSCRGFIYESTGGCTTMSQVVYTLRRQNTWTCVYGVRAFLGSNPTVEEYGGFLVVTQQPSD